MAGGRRFWFRAVRVGMDDFDDEATRIMEEAFDDEATRVMG
jgi:hypothetical protein